jgi:hypothetical protein
MVMLENDPETNSKRLRKRSRNVPTSGDKPQHSATSPNKKSLESTLLVTQYHSLFLGFLPRVGSSILSLAIFPLLGR